ncbi:hypothetical protein [Neobacillus sp.]|uniref:GAP1-N2 domain-containing protein n=1 Tax=Neobacillus sp. TaxID=2675273 RepID=UPI0028980AF7|nr:hypothetical protein [Neobacillus sp.]
MTGKFIDQQMYTRERGGIFHETDGYDTIAISAGLDKAFVKKYLHPFCSYSAPKVLTERGEMEASLFPEAVTIFQPESGELVIGQAVFVPADFTGTRSTYFMHNYIIPSAIKDEWIKQPTKLFQINEFATSYDVGLGKVLPEREVVGYDDRDILSVKDELLEVLGIGEVQFKQLLLAVMSSIAGKKRVFISLNVPLQDYSMYAMQLLELIYLYLPYAHRRKLGAMTFSSEPEGKKYIHVMFFEPGTLNYGDRSMAKQFIFDFAEGRISGVNIKGESHEYLEFALHHFSKSKNVSNFLDFAETMLSGLQEEQQLELTSYYQLTAIYLTLNYEDAPYYKNNKIGFLQSLHKFLAVNSEEKLDLVELFLQLLKGEKVASNKNMALDYIDAVVSINSILRCDEAIIFMIETLKYYQNDRLFHKLWKVIEQDKLSYQEILIYFNKNSNYGRLLESYFEEWFKPFVSVEDILNELKLLAHSPYLLSIEKFKFVSIKRIASAISNESNPFTSLLAVKDFNLGLHSPEFDEFKNDMLKHALASLLRTINVMDVTLSDVIAFGEISSNVEEWEDAKGQENYLVMIALYELFSNPANANAYDLKSLTGESRQQLRNILRKLFRSNPISMYFPLLFIAFGSEYKGVNYQGLLDYLSRLGHDKTMYSFIVENARLIDTDRAYKRALKKYFIKHPNSIWKNKALRKELKLIKNYSIKNFLKEIETETTSPLIKFLRRYGMTLSFLLVILGIGTGIWFGFFHDGKPKVQKPSETVTANNPGKKTATEEKKKTTSTKKTGLGENKKDTFTHLKSFKASTSGADGQSFKLDLAGKQVKNIIGQTHPNGSNTIVMTDMSGIEWQLHLTTEPEGSPFDDTGKLKRGYSFYGLEHNFSKNDIPELVLVATNKATHSYTWIFSFNSSGPMNELKLLTPLLSEKDFSDVQLEENKLILSKGDQDLTFEYSSDKQSFVAQKK